MITYKWPDHRTPDRRGVYTEVPITRNRPRVRIPRRMVDRARAAYLRYSLGH